MYWGIIPKTKSIFNKGEKNMWKKIIIDDVATNYSVSDEGDVRNDITNRLMTLSLQQGYCHVGLAMGGGKAKRCRVHQLVAEAFIPNPENKPYVNHIDGIRNNNKVNNLEWVTPSENTQHAVKTGLLKENARRRSVTQFDMEGHKIKTFESLAKATKETGCLSSKISLCCTRNRRSTNNFQWRYADDCSDVIAIEQKYFRGKRVAALDDNGKIVQIYPSMSEAAKSVNGSLSGIQRIIKGELIHHKGFRWILVDDIVQPSTN